MTVWPLQFRNMADDQLLFTDDAGGFFSANNTFLDRYISDGLTSADMEFLHEHGHAASTPDDPSFSGFAARWTRRINPHALLSYIILVPTLRCNLMCDYCQVSRAAETAKGFDWDEDQLRQVLDFLNGLETTSIKVEFQGGEPLLRLDHLEAVRSFCRTKFATSEFVVCTNLQRVSDAAWTFLSDDDTHVSTSFDGTSELHRQQRTKDEALHNLFSANFERAMRTLGADRVSALPTIDPMDPPNPRDVIDGFAELGLTSIYLRRINYQGFARKKFGFDRSLAAWQTYYRRFIEELISFNLIAEKPLEEFYLSHILRRILQGGHDGHVDLRNPNWFGSDYLVIDFDGTFYPTDEARMVSRIGRIDLSIGNLSKGLDRIKLEALNQGVSNFDDPDCVHCTYRPYCGLDPVDDLARYGRIDIPRHVTDHCQTHLGLFDFAFELLYSEDPAVHRSIAVWLDIPRYSRHLVPNLP
ncbi:His-Xaa-Ser system radical SAM maturase HxsB [Jannaschia sp. M317]|uniref:His-Xaa-Ser system radical SAM maturase HxsB n=1 Tax=Jannaschia sp. M317 TaxID=2867011 RepID=UPI0021A59DA8|nr:His-Xaa-Ser system radical SAM maturase HxsB [Jannaschia sp. M317]UWQ19276.1 His-Xaa-Ser system radical SAM maturase HxsB [Jannaschia sp. M317]